MPKTRKMTVHSFNHVWKKKYEFESICQNDTSVCEQNETTKPWKGKPDYKNWSTVILAIAWTLTDSRAMSMISEEKDVNFNYVMTFGNITILC